MELFKKYTDMIAWNSRMTDTLRGEWTIQMVTLQYVIGINKKYGLRDYTILHEICKDGDAEMMKEYLYLPEIEINAKDTDGWTALMYASAHGREKCVEILCKLKDIEI